MNDKIKAIAERVANEHFEIELDSEFGRMMLDVVIDTATEAAQAGYDLAKSESKWISVEDRLPDEEGDLPDINRKVVTLLYVFSLYYGTKKAKRPR